MFTAKTLSAIVAVFVLFTSGLANAIPHPAGSVDVSSPLDISPLYDRAYESAGAVVQVRNTTIDRRGSRKLKQSHSDQSEF